MFASLLGVHVIVFRCLEVRVRVVTSGVFASIRRFLEVRSNWCLEARVRVCKTFGVCVRVRRC